MAGTRLVHLCGHPDSSVGSTCQVVTGGSPPVSALSPRFNLLDCVKRPSSDGREPASALL